jgi:hypothetical protein
MNQKHDWEEISTDEIKNNHIVLPLLGSIGLGLAGLVLINPLAGFCVFAAATLMTYKKTVAISRQDEAIRQYDCYPITLDQELLAAYISEVGVEQTKEQLLWAKTAEYQMTQAAKDWLNSIEKPIHLVFDSSSSPSTEVADPILETTTAGVVESLNSLYYQPDIIAATPNQVQAQIQTRTVYSSQSQDENFDLVESILTKLSSLLFLAMPGCGKGVLISNLIRALKITHPNAIIIVIDPKGSKKEIRYWDGIADHLHRKQIKYLSSPEKIQWIKDGWEIFERESIKADGDYPVILILDEMLAVGGEFGTKDLFLQNKIKDVVSMGPSERQFVWIATQSPAVGDLGISGAIGNQLKKVIIARPEYSNMMKNWATVKYPLIAGVDFSPIDKCMAESSVGRAAYWEVDGKWRPMKELANHSGYNRDQETYDIPNEPEDRVTNNQHIGTVQITEPDISIDNVLLGYFSRVRDQTPKRMSDIQYAASVKAMNQDEPTLLYALERLVAEGKLETPIRGFWTLPDWGL